MKRYNKAFTLAELLIAMLIFALIAVMLIPNVTNNAERNLFATQVKKVQSDVQQAILWIISENQGSLKTVCIPNDADNNKLCIRNLIANPNSKKLEYYCVFGHDENVPNGRKDASNPQKQNAEYTSRAPQFLNGNAVTGLNIDNTANYHAAYLKNGAYFSAVFNPTCNNGAGAFVTGAGNDLQVCGYVEIDVNAGKAPNTVGKDIHYFWIVDKDGLVPFGEMDSLTCGNPDNSGNYDASHAKPEDDNTASHQLGCTARIMNLGSIDYY